MLFVIFVFIFSVFFPSKTCFASNESQVPCYFIFGDSTADPGNNNNLSTIAKANYPPYGIDFPGGVATGRFTNGRTYADVIAQLLGFTDFIPPFVGNVDNIMKGVNYASGAAGIRDETGNAQGERFNLVAQVSNHKNVVMRIEKSLRGRKAAAKYLNKCLYTIGIGSNDYVNNYFMPQFYSSSRHYNPDLYATALTHQYSRQLKTLYKEGARKVALIGVGQLGFTPVEMEIHANSAPQTLSDINNAAALFNDKLKSMVDQLNNQLTGAKFSFINTTAILVSENSPTATTGNNGLVLTSPCCKVGSNHFTCEANTSSCANRNQYAFFDNIHPTEGVNVLLGSAYYKSPSPAFVHPYDIATLAHL